MDARMGGRTTHKRPWHKLAGLWPVELKFKIWTATIIINFILKHHVLPTYQCIKLHENIKNNQNVCFLNDNHYKAIKNLSIEYAYRWWNYQALKKDAMLPSFLFTYL